MQLACYKVSQTSLSDLNMVTSGYKKTKTAMSVMPNLSPQNSTLQTNGWLHRGSIHYLM